MDFTIKVIFLVIFLGMLFISSKVLLDSNFEKMFKQGRITSIRVAYVVVIFTSSAFTAWLFTYVVNTIYTLLA